MEKDIGKIEKNPTTDVIIRIDDFGGKRGVTIREFVSSDRYTGFTKAGTRISPENFVKFREMINSIDLEELNAEPEESKSPGQTKLKNHQEKPKKKIEVQDEELPDY
jgi:hypothetical protein